LNSDGNLGKLRGMFDIFNLLRSNFNPILILLLSDSLVKYVLHKRKI
jgi:hypothetical protein